LVLQPFIRDNAGAAKAVATGLSGNIDWGCASAGNDTATKQGMAVAIPANPILAKYVPSSCK
ncbi:MAG: type IV pilin structural subunit, partial [Gammaproteobacteria bacterium]|nr:type IV pilin structural subunit [Gammaproteobacteria bacterium]